MCLTSDRPLSAWTGSQVLAHAWMVLPTLVAIALAIAGVGVLHRVQYALTPRAKVAPRPGSRFAFVQGYQTRFAATPFSSSSVFCFMWLKSYRVSMKFERRGSKLNPPPQKTRLAASDVAGEATQNGAPRRGWRRLVACECCPGRKRASRRYQVEDKPSSGRAAKANKKKRSKSLKALPPPKQVKPSSSGTLAIRDKSSGLALRDRAP